MKKTRSTTQTSITIPNELFRKLKVLASGSPNPNMSAIITKIVEDFFDNDASINGFLNIDKDDMLIPCSVYKEVEQISTVGFNSRIERKELEIVTIGVIDYVRIQEHSMKNTYLRVAELDRRFKEMVANNLSMQEQLNELSKGI